MKKNRVLLAAAAWLAMASGGVSQTPGKSDPSFSQPSRAPGVDYVLPTVYYYNRPTELGAMQGYGPVLMAGAEVIDMLRSFDIQRTLNTFHYRKRKK